jgi:hypothetical protein
MTPVRCGGASLQSQNLGDLKQEDYKFKANLNLLCRETERDRNREQMTPKTALNQ